MLFLLNRILLGVEDERKMAFPDYAQTSADHRRGKLECVIDIRLL